MSEDVHIIAVGARTPVGLTAEASAAAVRAGLIGITEHPFILDRTAEPVRMAQDAQLGPDVKHSDRLVEMTAAALGEVGHKLEGSGIDLRRMPVFLCLPEERPGWSHPDAQDVTKKVVQRMQWSEFRPIDILASGHAAGLIALHDACARLRSKTADLCIIAGADSYLQIKTLGWLDQNRQLATSYHRGAFFPGEGGGAFVLASDSIVQRYGLTSLARVRGMGFATETKLIKTEDICLGEGLSIAVSQAVEPLRLRAEMVDGILGDINGERYRTDEWGFTLLRHPEALGDATAYDLPTASWGDMGAASGPLAVMLAVSAGERGWAKGTKYLLWNSSEGGARAAAVLELNLREEERPQ